MVKSSFVLVENKCQKCAGKGFNVFISKDVNENVKEKEKSCK